MNEEISNTSEIKIPWKTITLFTITQLIAVLITGNQAPKAYKPLNNPSYTSLFKPIENFDTVCECACDSNSI